MSPKTGRRKIGNRKESRQSVIGKLKKKLPSKTRMKLWEVDIPGAESAPVRRPEKLYRPVLSSNENQTCFADRQKLRKNNKNKIKKSQQKHCAMGTKLYRKRNS